MNLDLNQDIYNRNTSSFLTTWLNLKDENLTESHRIILKEVALHNRINLINNIYIFEKAKNKFIIQNKFLKDEEKEMLFDSLFIAHRNRYLAKKYYKLWIYKVKKKYYEVVNNNDLMLEEFDENNFIEVYENNKIFRFTPKEINILIISCIHQHSYQIPFIKSVNNVYTKHKFTKIQLYNIYTSIRILNKKCHWLIHQFAKMDFDEIMMLSKYYVHLKHLAIRNDIISNYSEDEFRIEITYFLKKNITDPFLSSIRENYYLFDMRHLDIDYLRKKFTIPISNEYEIQYYNSICFIQSSNIINYVKGLEQENKTFVMNFWLAHPEIITNNFDMNIVNNTHETCLFSIGNNYRNSKKSKHKKQRKRNFKFEKFNLKKIKLKNIKFDLELAQSFKESIDNNIFNKQDDL